MQNVQPSEDSWDDADFQYYQDHELTFWDQVDAMAQGFYLTELDDDQE